MMFFIFADVLIIIFSLYFSFYIRFDFTLSFYAQYKDILLTALPIFLMVKLLIFAMYKIYNFTWRYVSIYDFFKLISAIGLSELILIVIVYFSVIPVEYMSMIGLPNLTGFPRSIVIIDGIVSLFLMAGVRISKRLYIEIIKNKGRARGKRTIIVGAGNTGEMILRDILRQGGRFFHVVGFIDDDKGKCGACLHGIKILGDTASISKHIYKKSVNAVIIAIPSLSHKELKTLYNHIKVSGIKDIKIVPRIYDFNNPKVNVKLLENLKIEDLIGRQVVKLDYKHIERFIISSTVLITGAGGSIGSEIAMQICAYNPKSVVFFDIDETAMHNLMLQIGKIYSNIEGRVHYIIGNIRDTNKVNDVFNFFKPSIVFHAGAYKHVPMMEFNPAEAIKVNVFGTYNIAEYAVKYGVKTFIMISTDKAVEPTSVMGASKRLAEEVCRALNGSTEFISVRFGNVLGSRGSVLPLFMEQLKEGGPLTVTHKEMKRYFMTIPEAVSLVLQASVIGKGGEVVVLDMGQPIKITHLAEELIRFHGLRPYEDIDIKFIGLRPGEKLFEELLTAEEGTVATKHEKLFVAKNSEGFSISEINILLDEFKYILNEDTFKCGESICQLLRKYVKHFDAV